MENTPKVPAPSTRPTALSQSKRTYSRDSSREEGSTKSTSQVKLPPGLTETEHIKALRVKVRRSLDSERGQKLGRESSASTGKQKSRSIYVMAAQLQGSTMGPRFLRAHRSLCRWPSGPGDVPTDVKSDGRAPGGRLRTSGKYTSPISCGSSVCIRTALTQWGVTLTTITKRTSWLNIGYMDTNMR